jgi:CRISPR-associated protein Cas1
VEGERLQVRKKDRTLFEAPLSAIRSVHVETYGMAVSSLAMEALADAGAPVLFGAPGRPPWGVLRKPTAAASSDLLSAQLAARMGPLSIEIARELCGAKLTNQERLLRYYAKYRRRRATPAGKALLEAADRIAKLGDDLAAIAPESDGVSEVDAARRRLFSAEGRAASAYWSAIASVLPVPFERRVGKGAEDAVNQALNYGYCILYGAVWAAVLRAGLEPGVGLLHASPGDRGSLVFDLIEPFRVPAVDKPLVSLLLRKAGLAVNRNGHLTAPTRRRVAGAIGEALAQPIPWGGRTLPLARHLERHAEDLAAWLKGGSALDALRIRW